MAINIEEITIDVPNNHILKELFGEFDDNINFIKNQLNIDILISNGHIRIIGESENIIMGKKLIHSLTQIIQKQNRLDKQDLRYTMRLIQEGKEGSIRELLDEIVCVTATGKSIKPKTLGQKRYLDSIRINDIVFGVGPAGTGKTFLAIAMAIQAFKNKEVNRIILTRPAVEAGENLGFLPGDLQEKVDPYLRPMYDALFEVMGFESYEKLLGKGLIEVAPLAYMRGRTLDSAYVILDEAQNTTNEQMKMFLTRLGFGSKAIITGDITQIDLPKGKQSGLKTIIKVLDNVEGIQFVHLSKTDIVRHPLIHKIIEAYERYESTNTL